MIVIAAGLSIYGLSSWAGLVKDDLQNQSDQVQIENQEFISEQIDNKSAQLEQKIEKKFDDLDMKRSVTSNRTQTIIINTEGNILNNLSDHRRIANLTYDTLFEQNKLLKQILLSIESNANKSLYNQEHFFFPWQNETFQKIFKALNIKETGSNFTLP